MSDLKQIIQNEYIKCAQDPAHFMRKYCFIQHPQRGRIIFNLFPYQEKCLHLFKENDYCIINKSRQLGLSTLVAGYALWLMLFHRDKNILCIATKQDTAKNMVSKVKYMYDNLPSWLTIGYEEKNKLTLTLSNGSKIKASSSSTDAGRSEAVSLLIIDEAAFIDNIGEIWASAQQTLATGGGAIVLSTPYNTGNWFHSNWAKAETGAKDNLFLPIRLPWWVHPERDQKWRDDQDIILGDPRIAAQECDCEFNMSGDTVFYKEYLEFYKETYIKDPIEKRGIDNNLWIWEAPNYSHTYMVVADVARGDGKDFSTFHVIDVDEKRQVAEYKGQIGTRDFGHLLVGIATEYNEALLAPENANIGWDTVQTIVDRGYANLYYSPKGDKLNIESYFDNYDTTQMIPGFITSPKVRPMMIGKIQEAIKEQRVIFYSKRLLDEMEVFIWKNGKAQAQQGYNDDLVMAFGIGMFLMDTSVKYSQNYLEMSKATLSNIQSSNTPFAGVYNPNGKIENPYKVKIKGGMESIKWLL